MGYSDFDRERFLAEDRSTSARRDEFARDRARVLHSSALRRLGAKTQVLEAGKTDFARTRLTHSLEVAQIGREMANDLSLNADVVDLACLAHDLGHPPFGHNGETALDAWAESIGGFEGNAQTLRLLSRIEPKVFTESGRSVGLNLTRAALDATCKYPWKRIESNLAGEGKTVKFGYYEDDSDVFHWMRQGSQIGVKAAEAQVMDFADDVAYSVHDFEDAIVSGYVQLSELANPANEAAFVRQIADWNLNKTSHDELAQALNRLQSLEYWPTSYSGTPTDLGRLKNLTSSLIGRFVRSTTDASYESAGDENFARYSSSIVIPAEVKAEIAVLKGIVSVFLMSLESRRGHYEWQRLILTELADALLSKAGKELDAYSSGAWQQAGDEVSQRRVIVDQIACLTDQSALDWHHRLVTKRA
ncbi:MAG: deoxyguanosinetriphosphate triphosphohydrolase [Micrococcales bacterium]